jgi:Flp pilus assembly protein TadG
MPGRRSRENRSRRGAVAVEFAIIAPVLLTLVVGMIEASRLFEAQNLLASAAREGARLAAMDREGLVAAGESTNDKIEDDVRNFLVSQGYDPEDVQVQILHADTDDPFDLDDPENDLELFRLQIQIPYSEYTSQYVPGGEEFSLGAEVVFRNGRAVVAG